MPHRSTRSSAYVPQNPRSTHPLRAETGPVPIQAQPLTRREARMLEALVAPSPATTPTTRAAKTPAASIPAAFAAAPAAAPAATAPVTPAAALTAAVAVAPEAFASRRDRRAAETARAQAAARPARRPAPRRFSLAVPRKHLVLAVSGGLVVAVVAAGISLTAGATPTTGTAMADAPAPTATALPTIAAKRVLLSSVSATSGTVVGGTSVTLTGSNLDTIAAVRFGGVDGAVSVAGSNQITITAPPAPGQTEGTVDVAFYDAAGTQVTFDAVTDVAASATSGGTTVDANGTAVADTSTASSGSTPLATDGSTPAAGTTSTPAADAPDAVSTSTGPIATTKVIATALAFSYTPDPAIEAAKAAAALRAQQLDAQLAYVEAHWSDYNSSEYGVISGNDCMNFTSQSLIARGWTMDSEWSYSSGGGYSSAWASSTAFAEYMAAHPERGTALTNAQRDEVEVGDVVQFDWDGSGDWDHTGIVTRIDGSTIYYSSHTSDNNDQSIDSASAGRIGFWSIA